LPDASGEQEPWEQQPEHRSDPHHEHHHTHPTYQQYQPEYRAEHQQEYPLESQLKPQLVHHTSETMVRDTAPEPAYHVEEPTPIPMALSTEQVRMDSHEHTGDMQVPALSAVPQYVRGEEHVSAYIQPSYQMPHVEDAGQHPEPDIIVHQDGSDVFHIHHEHPAEPTHTPASPEPDVKTFEPPKAEWDASR
jgi:glycogenin glucosyltransferase